MSELGATAILNGGAKLAGDHLLFVANRTYRIEPGRRAIPVADAAPVAPDARWVDSTNEDALPRLVDEGHAFLGGKTLTDVLVRGSAWSTNGAVAVLDTAVAVGPARKAVRVHGERRVEVRDDGRFGFSKAAPFDELALVWDHAFGGRDIRAEAILLGLRAKGTSRFGKRREADGVGLGKLVYPRNAAGRGYFMGFDRSKIDGTLAPALEDPTDPVTPDRLVSDSVGGWIDQPVSACYEAIDFNTFPRLQFFLPPKFDPPKRKVQELASGALLVEDLARSFDPTQLPHPRVYACAPAGLSVARLRGDERAQIWGMHPKHAYLDFELPDDAPTMSLEIPGVGVRQLEARLATVLVEPNEERVTLTWAGIQPVAMAYPEEMLTTMRRAVRWKKEMAK